MHKTPAVILFYKPYGVLAQFTSADGRSCLKDFGPFPPDVYPAGRLDFDSEGLLVLTNDSAIGRRLTEPRFNHEKTYLVQVEGIPGKDAIEQLRSGLTIAGHRTKPAGARILDTPPSLPERSVPIRTRKSKPTCWLEMTLREGRNRQVRRMTAAVGHPTLRLLRTAIGAWSLANLAPGEHYALNEAEIARMRLRFGLNAPATGTSRGRRKKETPAHLGYAGVREAVMKSAGARQQIHLLEHHLPMEGSCGSLITAPSPLIRTTTFGPVIVEGSNSFPCSSASCFACLMSSSFE